MILLVPLAAIVAIAAIAFGCAAARRARRATGQIDRLQDENWELREVAAARDRAEAANDAKTRFLANVSHELRTPLNGILGMAELLDGTPLDGEQGSYVAAIRSSGGALAALIDEILDFSKIEAGKVDLASEPFDVTRLVEGVAELLAPRAQDKGLEIATHVAADVPGQLVGDAGRLRQVLLNLAGNAVKFTDQGGVGLRVAVSPAGIRFEVEDTGIGIPHDRRAAIFEDFEQADSSVTRRHGGTGLGLAISRRLVERMGGTLALADAARGSCFCVDLPLAAAPGERPDGPRTMRPGSTALIVAAADLFEAPFLSARFAAAGAVADRLVGADAALRRLEAQSYDLVVVDCALGEPAGAAICAAARRAGVGRVLVLFSPYERRVFGKSAAFDGWLVKPVRQRSFLDLVAGRRAGAAIRAPAPGRPAQAARRVAVLLAEDNDINALLATRHLERMGAGVTRVADGLAALDRAGSAMTEGTPFDAVILDIRMPGLDGLNVARRIRAMEHALGGVPTRLVALSADVLDGDEEALARAGLDDFVAKPMTAARLAEALAPVLAVPVPACVAG